MSIDELEWEYVDRHARVQGKFSTHQMHLWFMHGMLPENLQVRWKRDGPFYPMNLVYPSDKVPFVSRPADVNDDQGNKTPSSTEVSETIKQQQKTAAKEKAKTTPKAKKTPAQPTEAEKNTKKQEEIRQAQLLLKGKNGKDDKGKGKGPPLDPAMMAAVMRKGEKGMMEKGMLEKGLMEKGLMEKGMMEKGMMDPFTAAAFFGKGFPPMHPGAYDPTGILSKGKNPFQAHLQQQYSVQNAYFQAAMEMANANAINSATRSHQMMEAAAAAAAAQAQAQAQAQTQATPTPPDPVAAARAGPYGNGVPETVDYGNETASQKK